MIKFWRRRMYPEHEIDDLRADVRRVEDENERLSAEVIRLQSVVDMQTATISGLNSELEVAQYMRQVIAKCRDDAEARANGHGHYVPGAV